MSLYFLLAAPVQAAGQAILRTEQNGRVEQTPLVWLNDRALRMDLTHPPAEILLHQGSLYVISQIGGLSVVATVASADQLAQALGQGAGALDQINHEMASSVSQFEAMGHQETIAGIRGEQYRVVWVDQQGKSHTDVVVLSHAPVVVELTRALQNMAVAANKGRDARMIEFVRKGWGVLRYGQAYRLESISEKSPESGLLALPTQSIDVQGILQGLSR
ncbi:MAG: hypothetical protein B7X35_03475 [Halothiobacillus sp. 14-56-357]|nr:MAG: hypothetical protein B7X44_03350 [Halothiobacillus sp. 15-55-196]OZB56928.1 MAG: hypothetical protein B7X35_03475 [Halothiobacillus sp. 14-56-357]OZB79119.1 MAG: hypothetical protein B7X29_02190 [Halothiobacillus sp. 13-55-115]